MSDPFVAEIRLFAGNFAPRGWALCNGQLMPISQNTALFSLIGTYYGGDGRTTFALPDLRDRLPMHAGAGPGLSSRVVGEQGGSAAVSLTTAQLPSHTHQLQGVASAGTTPSTTGTVFAEPHAGRGADPAYAPRSGNTVAPMSVTALSMTGGSQPHNNLPPYLALTFIIALQGVFPARS